MRILVVTPHYLPDGGPSAPLYAMLCEALVRRGHQVTVVVAVPHYPSGQVPKEYRGVWARRSNEQGVQVIRVPVPSVNRANLLQRFIQLLAFQMRATWAGLFCSYDFSIFSNPALSTGLPFAVLSVLRHKPAIYSVHDAYPQVGITLGVFKNRCVIAMVSALERFCLNHATFVRVLSESFVPSIRDLGVPDSKISLIYDWVDTDLIRPLERDNSFARENDLVDKFVVMYAGNLGLSQGLENVLLVAEQLQDYSDIQFVFVGDGTARAHLIAMAQKKLLPNVSFLPFQPRSRLPEVLATADVSLVVLQRGIGLASLPSKIFSILASGRPLIVSVDEYSDTARLVHRSGAGICVPPESPRHLAEAILKLRDDPLARYTMGKCGRAYALQHHSPDAAAEAFAGLLSRA